jgi:hypothetical protein
MENDKSKYVYLVGTKEGAPYAEAYLGNGAVTASLRELCRLKKYLNWSSNLEKQPFREFPREVMCDFVGKVEPPIVMDNRTLNPEEMVKIIQQGNGVRWFLLIR